MAKTSQPKGKGNAEVVISHKATKNEEEPKNARARARTTWIERGVKPASARTNTLKKYENPARTPEKKRKWENYFSLKDKQQPRQEIAAVAAAGEEEKKKDGKWSEITGK